MAFRVLESRTGEVRIWIDAASIEVGESYALADLEAIRQAGCAILRDKLNSFDEASQSLSHKGNFWVPSGVEME